ncbi:hypothetical protein F0562_009846 [Nyssa sinensis]|uniref:Uncharacterized protein n=1 Tax=Nyssa sinensis TaxID=561372 RepID=A0A5J4ZX79_9ASTE|nr:hypothetical protein F0562_009846 [Nyssa sinensis]
MGQEQHQQREHLGQDQRQQHHHARKQQQNASEDIHISEHSVVAPLRDNAAGADPGSSAPFADVAPGPSLFVTPIVHATTVHATVAILVHQVLQL